MEFKRYKLFGYLNLFPGLPGFLYPVFLNNGSFYLANGNIRYIYSFFHLKQITSNLSKNFPVQPNPTVLEIIIPIFIRKKMGKFFSELKIFFTGS